MMGSKTERPYGLWSSPITPLSLARGMKITNLAWAGDGSLVWVESRPDRAALVVQAPDGQAARDLNSEYSARGRIGYGGGEFGAGQDTLFFVESKSGRIFRQPLHGERPQPLTPAFGSAAAPTPSPDGRWLVYVHSYENQDCLAVVDAGGKYWPQKLVSGNDFYMQPAWQPGSLQPHIAWVTWNHPHMPWDRSSLQVGRLAFPAGGLPRVDLVVTLAGEGGPEPNPKGAAVFQPQFSPDGRFLAFISDASGWGQLHLHDMERGETRRLTHAPAEHATPAWVQGMRRYDFSPDGSRIYFLRTQMGFTSLWQIDLKTGQEQQIPLEDAYSDLEQIAVSPDGQQIALLASGPAQPQRLITVSTTNPGTPARVWRRSGSEELSPENYAQPEPLEWQGMDGEKVYGLFYAPHSPRFEAPGKPPVIVHIHGGPTSQERAAFEPDVQFFTSRGYAVLEVNYRGSSGYGRAYQDALRGNWGIYDVQDPVSGARALVEMGRVDAQRLVIMGGSAGGFSVLKALEDYPGFFKAGICLYGISNQFTAALETVKFEEHYSDWLLGPLPEAASLYRERSPLFFADRIQDPVALFQGEDDPVVQRSQSDDMAASLRQRGVPHEYHVYPGEGHGFRKPETLEHFYKTVESFLRQYVIFA